MIIRLSLGVLLIRLSGSAEKWMAAAGGRGLEKALINLSIMLSIMGKKKIKERIQERKNCLKRYRF